MNEQGEFQHLISIMVPDFFPGDEELWALVGSRWITELYQRERIGFTRDRVGDADLLTHDQIREAVELVNAIVATFKAYKYIRGILKAGHSPTKTQLLEAWSKTLVEGGIKKEKAEKISEKLYKEFKALSEERS